ncbi:penicillin acylase family protein, partial [Duganella callida]
GRHVEPDHFRLMMDCAAIVADDMHLGIQLPAIWYRAALQYPDGKGGQRRVVGVTLPGAPFVVVGSNGHVAWGFTNSYGDYMDFIALDTDAARPGQVRTQAGWETPVLHEETILVKGAPAARLAVRETSLGPVRATPAGAYALHWTAHTPRAVNFNGLRLESADTLEQALAIAPTLGIPAQNFVGGDDRGNIGWTIAGPLPRRAAPGVASTYPMTADDPAGVWQGWLAPDEYPKVLNPPGGHLATANSRQLAGSGAISAEDIHHAEDSAKTARAALDVAQQQLASAGALIDQTSVASHPEVQAAVAQLREAYIANARTTLRAPVSGLVTKRSVQLGQRVNAGAALMSIVPPEQMWVNANFKESQLRDIRIGQTVELSADVYGKQLRYRGRVIGQDAGTGSAFALLPAQNASGNWIKVVQRVPIRIALDPQQLAAHPLKLGLSMHVTVDTHDRSGAVAKQTVAGRAAYTTDVFAHELAEADQLVERIVADAGAHTVTAAATARLAKVN